MKTKDSWTRVAPYIFVSMLLSTFLIFAAFRSAEVRHSWTAVERSGLRADQPSQLSGAKTDTDKDIDWTAAYGKLPLAFEKNQGQTTHEVQYISHGEGYGLFLTTQEAVLLLRHSNPPHASPLHRTATIRDSRSAGQAEKTSIVRIHFEGANSAPQIEASDRLPGKVNYFIGSDPKDWHADIPSYARVKYTGVYPGIDLVFYGNQSRLEYDLVVAPGADPSAIKMNLDGANKLRINANGDLVLSVSGGEVELQKPVVYQQVNGTRHEIAGRYLLAGKHDVSFAVANYDRSEPLVLDPVLNYSSYLGGSSDDSAFGIAVDAQGDAFVTGTTFSTAFPTTASAFNKGPLTVNTKGAVFVTELNPAGTQQLYSTYLAGSGGDSGSGIALDSSGKIYVTGQTSSIDFPTTSNALKPGPLAANALGTSFVSKIDPTLSGTSSLVYSSYLGGPNGDFGSAITADAGGNAYVTGFTKSLPGSGPTAFPITSGAFQSALSSAFGNAFLSRIDTTKSGSASLIYSTYLGGNGANATNPASIGFGDGGFGIAADSSSAAYITGVTTSTNFPTTATTAFQAPAPGAATLGTTFVSKIDTSGGKTGTASLLYSTYLGGEKSDFGLAIALGPNNVAYVTGTTSSLNFPTFPGAFQTTGNAFGAAFISLLDTGLPGSTSLKYSTFLGGTGSTTAFGIRVDAAGNAYVAGQTNSASFPVTSGAFQTTLATGAVADAFISELSPGAKGAADLIYSTYFGGKGTSSGSTDAANAIAIDASKNVYITGTTFSTNLPVFPNPGAFQTALKGNSDAFIAKLILVPTLTVSPTSLNLGTVLVGATTAAQTVTLTNNSNTALAISSTAVVAISPPAANVDFAISSNTCGTSVPSGASCSVNVTFKPSVAAAESAKLVFTDSDSSSPQSVSLSGTGSNIPPDFSVSAPATLSVNQGSSGTATVTVTPIGGFNSAVSLACTGAPALATCTISPASVTPADGVTPVTAQLSVTTTALVPPQSIPASPISIPQVVPVFLAFMLLLVLSFSQLESRARTRLGMAAAMLFFIVLAGCSKMKHDTTPKGTSNLTITAKSGSTTHTTTVALTVN
ncbi:MAG TPA: SBBP repeat-containing protein [Candidatus Dormibacteraeota bacterium]|nr:SBBP repeat-containing protein [Candidatus Dormibacteraeota bacterium]